MATLKRSDILRKHANRGRPPKPEKERQLKQRAAYQWRDARRIYLAASFERWRKLRSRLQLKDSSLAWHLLETHDKGCYDCSLQGLLEEESSLTEPQNDSASKDPSKFHPAMVRMLRQLCHTYLNFEDCVELVGLVCVERDHKTKETHSVNELVKRGLLPKQRTHERHQTDLEASEADLVAAALSRCERGEESNGTDVSNSDSMHQEICDDEASMNCDEDDSDNDDDNVANGTSDELHSAQEYGQGTSPWDGVAVSVETPVAVSASTSTTEPQSLVANSLPQKQFEAFSQSEDSGSARADQETVSSHVHPYHNYDETDHSAQPGLRLHHTDHCDSPSRDLRFQGSSSPWHTHDPSVACKTGESHKVVLSDDGRVSHVVHNGPASGQVYRIDLSNHEENRAETGGGPAVDTGEESQGGVRSRDRAASMESNDSFMEVGIVSKIHHAQQLLASPPPSPKTDPSHSADSQPSFSPATQSSDPSHSYPEHPPPPLVHPAHTSVIREVFSPQRNTDLKTEPAPSSSGEERAEPEEALPDDRDLPLDMSLVKDETDNPLESHDNGGEHSRDSGRQSADQNIYRAHGKSSNSAQDDFSPSASPPTTTADDSQMGSHELPQLPYAASSMQLLQHYTDRILQQQQQVNADLSALHASHAQLLAADSDDSTRARKRKLSDLDDRDGEGGRGSIPWPRKDMTQKEEYQFLEMDPFMDFAEMSRLFPNMQQRTFYRWKRRIKDQFICVEQQPGITYAQFSQYFPQVKDQVFDHWKGLMTKGHRFLGDTGKPSMSLSEMKSLASSVAKATSREGEGSASHKEGEGGGSGHHEDYISQYIFLQKNLSLDAEQFAQVFPEVPQQLFYMWKKQIFADFLKLQANPKLTYQEFRKQASVTQDVFSLWKAHLTLINTSTPLISTCPSLVPAPSPLTSSTPTLPPVSLLAGSKGVGADLAAWYASYAPLLGQMAMPFWSPLSIMSSPPLPSSLPSLRDSSSQEREHDHDSVPRDQPSTNKQSDRDRVRRKSSSESSKSKDTESQSRGDKAAEPDSPSPHTSEGGEGVVGHRGRRQSLKPEHYYYLMNPDTPYLALTHLFPGVSAQRYGRWRRKVSSALALLEREPNCTGDQFALSFPNVPDEILSSWRDRVKHGHARLMVAGNEADDDLATSHHQLSPSPSPAQSDRHSQDLTTDAGSAGNETPNFLLEKYRDGEGERVSKEDRGKDYAHHDSPASMSSRKQFKLNREEFHFVQRYPNVDFGTFSRYYTNISVRTFYRWRRQIRDAIDMLRANLSLTLPEFQKLVPEVTEDVFDAWQALVREEVKDQKERGGAVLDGIGEESSASATDTAAPTPSSSQSHLPTAERAAELRDVSGQCRPEQWLVHMNPNLDYAEISRTYPHVSERTFYRWKQEVRQIMDYMRDRSDVRYEDIASVLPAVSREAFLMWQHLLNLEKFAQQNVSKVKTEATSQPYEGLSASSLVGDVAEGGSRSLSDSLLRTGQDAGTRETGQDAVTRETVPAVSSSSSLSEAAEPHVSVLSLGEDEESSSAKSRRQTRDEFIHVMLNPAMDYAEFARRFGTVSQRTFYRWRAHIRDWRAAIRADPHMDYATFSRSARDVPESVFQVWREWETRAENPHNTSSSYDGYDSLLHSTSQPTPTQSLPTPPQSQLTSQAGRGSGESDGWKNPHPHASQLEVLCAAYDHYQRHPDMQFEALTPQFPSVTVDVFQQWKKGVDMKLEYIRSIPTTNFDDFHSLFPDVKEDIFLIWKAKVLSGQSSGENFLFPQTSGGESAASALPTQSSAFTASSHSSQSFYPQTASLYAGSGAKHDEGSSLHYSLQSRRGKSPLPSVYQTVPSASHSPRLQPSPAKLAEEGLTAEDFHASGTARVRVKLESSPNTPLPSFTETVSNLGRLSAMVQHRLPQPKQAVAPTLTPASALLYPHTTSAASVADTLNSSYSNTARHSTPKSSTAPSHSATSGSLHHDSQLYASLAHAAVSDSVVGASHLEDSVVATSDAGSGSAKDEDGGGEERGMEGLVYSSQRQRKLQRVEYMFVEQNPDVDVQEFLNRFPKVSLRTFYRWKREIREEQQAAGGANIIM